MLPINVWWANSDDARTINGRTTTMKAPISISLAPSASIKVAGLLALNQSTNWPKKPYRMTSPIAINADKTEVARSHGQASLL